MKTIAVIILLLTSSILIGLPFQNGSANNMKSGSLAPILEKAYTKTDTDPNIPNGDGYGIKACYVFPVYRGDNITINTTISGSYGQLWFGGYPDHNLCYDIQTLLDSLFSYKSVSNVVAANQGFITNTENFWITSDLDQMMTIIIRVYSSPSSITYAINKINATPPQDPAIKILQNQVKDLQTNMTNAQTQIQQLTQQINIMNNTQKQMLVNITNLWNAFDKLNASLTDLTDIVNNINTSQNYSKNITWIEQNITHIKQDISKLFSNDTSNYYSLLTDLQITNRWLMNLSDQFYLLANDTSKIYNDTALKNQIAQLQKENAQLRANIDTLNKTKNEKTIEKRADNTVSYGAIALGIVALIVGIIAIMTRMPKTPTKDDSDEASRSKDYEEVEEKPKEIPKAKAKKSKDDDDEDLDDVMKKLEK